MKFKKANLISIWWFFILTIVGTGIVIGTITFYGAKTDVKKLEADRLSDRITNCIIDNGITIEDIKNKEIDLFDECGIDEKLISNSQKYFFKINLIKGEDKEEIIKYGPDFEKDCKIRERIFQAPKFPLCSTKMVEIMDDKGNQVKIEVVAGSNYEGGNLYA